MSIYNREIAVRNINRLMKEKNLRQTDLIRITGIRQPRMSACIGINPTEDFTLSQFVDIAEALDVTTDSLISNPSSSNNDNIKTLADIMERLFEIDAAIKAEVKNVTYKHKEEIPLVLEGDVVTEKDKQTYSIIFHNDFIEKKLAEWNEIACSSLEPEMKKKCYHFGKKKLSRKQAHI